MDIDRTKVASLGVPLDEVNQTLSIYLGSLYVNSFNIFGRHWQVNVQADGNFRNENGDINQLQVRNNEGQMVQLGRWAPCAKSAAPFSSTATTSIRPPPSAAASPPARAPAK